MKIAVIAHSHYPIIQPFSGGLEAHTYHLTKELQKAGHDVVLYAAQGSDETLPAQVSFRPTAVEQFKPTSEVIRYREVTYQNVMADIKYRDFDIVHNNCLHYVPLYMADELEIPMVTVLHTPPFIPMLNGFRKAIHAKNHGIIAISNKVAELWNNELSNIHAKLIYNGIDVQKWKPQNNLHKQRYAVWFGRITPDKGTHYAIEACIKANIPLKLCGPVHDEQYFEQNILPIVERYESIEYLGNLDIMKLSKIVANAAVFTCTPCWDEPFGLVVAEALAAGTPIAGFRRGALPEILDNDISVLVEENSDALAEAILKAEQLSSEKCREKAVKCFSHDVMVANYVSFYKDMIQAYDNSAKLSQCHG